MINEYEYLWKGPNASFTIDQITDRHSYLTKSVHSMIYSKLGLIDKAWVNDKLLQLAVLDYFVDIDRIKDFHPIDLTGLDKVYGYGMHWFLRRKPIQLSEDFYDGRYLYINEIVAANILIDRLTNKYRVKPQSREGNQKVVELANLLIYNFKYRVHTQQSLELAINAFLAGIECMKFEIIDNK